MHASARVMGCACRVGRAAEKLQDAAGEMAHVATVVEATSQPMARRDPLRKHMDIIYQEARHSNPWSSCSEELMMAHISLLRMHVLWTCNQSKDSHHVYLWARVLGQCGTVAP